MASVGRYGLREAVAWFLEEARRRYERFRALRFLVDLMDPSPPPSVRLLPPFRRCGGAWGCGCVRCRYPWLAGFPRNAELDA